MSTAPLTRDLLAQPELWHLRMLAGPEQLDVLLLPPVESEQLIYRRFMLDPEAASPGKAIEEIIYANPLLLADFKTTTCLIETEQSMFVPTEVAPDSYYALMDAAFECSSAPLVVTPTGTETAVCVTAADAEAHGFLSRTFYNIRFANHLAALCSHLVATSVAGGPTIYCEARAGRYDVVALDGCRLLAANTFECGDSAADGAYYLLAMRNVLGLDAANCSIVISGKAEEADALEAQLAEASVATQRAPEMPLPCHAPTDISFIPTQLLIHNISCE